MRGSGRRAAVEPGPIPRPDVIALSVFDLPHHLLGQRVHDAVDEIQ
jgi:hypothetical protein